MSFDFGELVVVRFPFTDLSSTKQRPAVVVSSREYNERRLDVVLMAASSRIRDPLSFGEILVNAWSSAGLLKPSVIRPVIATVQQDIVLGRLGRLQDVDERAVRGALGRLLTLTLGV